MLIAIFSVILDPCGPNLLHLCLWMDVPSHPWIVYSTCCQVVVLKVWNSNCKNVHPQTFTLRMPKCKHDYHERWLLCMSRLTRFSNTHIKLTITYKVCGCYLDPLFNRNLVSDWYVVWWGDQRKITIKAHFEKTTDGVTLWTALHLIVSTLGRIYVLSQGVNKCALQ